MLRLKHLVLLGREITSYSVSNRVWWFLPVMLVLGVVALAMTTTSAAVPVAVYTLF